MYPRHHALSNPNKPAYIMEPSGEVVTYERLDARSSQCAHLLRHHGFGVDAPIALLVENHARFFELCWAAQRAGLTYTPISTHLTAGEIAFILRDCGARAFIASASFAGTARAAVDGATGVAIRLAVGGPIDGFLPLEESIAGFPIDPIDDELEGREMLYSSGTTGKPKGICSPQGERTIGTPPPLARGLVSGLYELTADSIYLSPAPSYHSSPLRFVMATQRLGATAIILETFEPRLALRCIERHRVTHSQWVPTMFARMLKLPADEREEFDLSSQRIALHAAAPCPVSIKRQMIDWWGPILHEFYSATEGNGATLIDSHEWLAHPGSVGKAFGCEIHIVDDKGREVEPGESGTVYFSGGRTFEYHNDPEKTERSHNRQGWSTVGDVGYLDDEGYLYLTDRQANMIISGGVNIYPQEAENVLIGHPKVADVAVFGIPNEEFGEEVKAVVQVLNPADAGPDLAAELLDFCRAELAAIKCPRSIDFDAQLPRSDSGKLYKRHIRDRYWQGHSTRIL